MKRFAILPGRSHVGAGHVDGGAEQRDPVCEIVVGRPHGLSIQLQCQVHDPDCTTEPIDGYLVRSSRHSIEADAAGNAPTAFVVVTGDLGQRRDRGADVNAEQCVETAPGSREVGLAIERRCPGVPD